MGPLAVCHVHRNTNCVGHQHGVLGASVVMTAENSTSDVLVAFLASERASVMYSRTVCDNVVSKND